MNDNCKIVRDLIPLYLDNIASDESIEFIESHIKSCEDCKHFLKLAQTDIPSENKFEESFETTLKKIKREKTKRIVIHSILIAILLIFSVFGVKHLISSEFSPMPNCVEVAFTKEIYSEIKKPASNKDKETLTPIVKDIEEALNFIGTEKEAKEKFGELYWYTVDSELYDDAVYVETQVNFVTAKLYHDTGYLWIKYDQEAFDKSGNLVMGISDTESRITVVKYPGEESWTPIAIREAP